MMIMQRLSGDISAISFVFLMLDRFSGVYKPVRRSLSFVDTIGSGEKVRVIHTKPETCQQQNSSFQYLFEHMVVVVDLGVFLA